MNTENFELTPIHGQPVAELFSIGINLDLDCIDHINRHYYLQYVHIASTYTI